MILELFAGAGGASLGIHRALPNETVVGLEWDPAACHTRAKAGLLTIRTDVSLMPLAHLIGLVTGLWGSPPCPQFSAAGAGSGVAILGLLCAAILDLLRGEDTRAATRMHALPVVHAAVTAENKTRRKPRTDAQIEAETQRRTTEALLVLEPARFAHALRPQWIACEQVPAVLPIWRTMATGLERLGYACWTGQLDTADYGVAQNRLRAVLMARLGVPSVSPPEPTHSDQRHSPSLFASQEWVSMADRLGWGMTGRPGMTVACGTGGGPDPTGVGGSGALRVIENERDEGRWIVKTRGDSGREQDNFDGGGLRGSSPPRAIRGCAMELDRRTNSRAAGGGTAPTARVPDDRPAPTVTAMAGGQWLWCHTRPSTCVMGDTRIAPPGYRGGHDERSRPMMSEAIHVELHELAALQDFPDDYPFQGNKTQRARQIGNAVPPPLAEAIVRALTS